MEFHFELLTGIVYAAVGGGIEVNMNEELGQIDADLKGLFMENNTDEMIELLQVQPEEVVKEISEYNWNVIKKYFDTERFELLFQHFKFVAYTCFIVEYTYQIGLISEESFETKMAIYNNIYEMKRQQS